MMFKVARVLLPVTLLLLAGCGEAGVGQNTPVPTGGKLKVTATTTQIKSMAEAVGGDAAEVRSILPPGADAHEFEPKPADVQAIAESSLVLKNGIGLDDWVDRLVQNAGGERPMLLVTEGIPLREGGDEDEEEAGGHDPHVWLSVTNAMTMTRNIRDALAQADPARADTYRGNADAYLQKLDELDKYIETQIGSIPREQRKMVTNHDAFGYYLERYGLTFVGSIIPSMSTEAQPSAKDIAEITGLIEAEGVKAIFLESSTNPSLARQIASDTGVKVVDNLYADSLGDDASPAATYEAMMRHNTDRIVEALR